MTLARLPPESVRIFATERTRCACTRLGWTTVGLLPPLGALGLALLPAADPSAQPGLAAIYLQLGALAMARGDMSRAQIALLKGLSIAKRLATVEQAARWLVANRSADRETANAVAYGTVLKVCSKHARDDIPGDLSGYFWKSVKNNYCKDHGRNPLAQCNPLDTLDARCDGGVGFGSVGQLDAAIDLRARLCLLDPRDRDIVLRDFDGETSQEIADDLNMSAANVRKRLERAYKKMATH